MIYLAALLYLPAAWVYFVYFSGEALDFGGLLERTFATYTGYMSIPLALLLPFWLIRNLFSIRSDIGGRPFAIVFMCNLFILQYLNAEPPPPASGISPGSSGYCSRWSCRPYSSPPGSHFDRTLIPIDLPTDLTLDIHYTDVSGRVGPTHRNFHIVPDSVGEAHPTSIFRILSRDSRCRTYDLET
jgi:hypothetical protein